MVKPIKPIYQRWDPDLQEWHWGLAPEDFMKVQAGYACPRCLEPFESWMQVCPVCGLEQHRNVVLPAPSEWRN